MKSILAISILTFTLLITPAIYAQSEGDTPPDETMADPVPISIDPQIAPTAATVTAATPAPSARIQATVLKIGQGQGVCAVGSIPKPNPNGCVVELLPNPSNPRPPISQYDWSPGPIGQIPSPVGAPIFSSLFQTSGGMSEDFAEFRLTPLAMATYGYSCPQTQCTGGAQDVWRATSPAQREEYLSAVIEAERANQSWGAQRFVASVVALDPGQEMQGRGCAVATESDPIIRFAASCAGPFLDHLAP